MVLKAEVLSPNSSMSEMAIYIQCPLQVFALLDLWETKPFSLQGD